MAYNSIRPGQIWLDTEGKRIQAHGGSVFYENGTYYWYGENKEKTDGKNGIWHWGVRAYRSTDLYNWEDMGLIIPPDLEDESSTLHPKAQMDRPHIIYNAKTKKYVCWLKIMGEVQTSTVLTADRFLGPYTKVQEGLRPLDMSAGDFDLAVDPDGSAYYYFEKVHTETICADLTEDFTNVTGHYSSHFPHPHPPFVREATAHFERQGKHYLLTSGTTGYLPNPSQVAVAEDYHGPFTVLGDPHPTDPRHCSFHSQIASVFKVPGKKDLYIACADRWVPDFDLDAIPYAFYGKLYELIFTGQRKKMGELAAQFGIGPEKVMPVFGAPRRNTSVADYVWLPLRFVEPCEEYPNGMVLVDWKDEWRIEDYD